MKMFFIIVSILLVGFVPESSNSQQKKAESIDSTLLTVDIGHMFLDPVSFSVDPLGMIYILDHGRNTIEKISLQDTAIVVHASYSWRDNAMNRFQDIVSPNGLDVYVADYGSNRVHRFDRDLIYISSIPQDDVQASMEKVMGFPASVAVDRFGALYVVDKENKRICKIVSNNKIERYFGGYDAGFGRLVDPHTIRISMSEDRVFVSDLNRIVAFDIYGNYITSRAVPGSGRPFVVEEGSLIVVDSCAVSLFNTDEKKLHSFIPRIMGNRGDCPGIIDAEINQGVLYLLTKKYLILARVRYQTSIGE